MAEDTGIVGGTYHPTQEEINEYRSGIPPKNDSLIYSTVKKMSTDTLRKNQQKYMHFLRNMESNTMAYEIAYHKWFALRLEGEKRGLWDFSTNIKYEKDEGNTNI